MELNPKFWGSLDLAIESGVDFPSDTVRVALGDSLKANFDFDSKKFFVWPLEEPSKYLRDREIQKRMYRTNIKLSDPAPALYQSLQKIVLSIANKSTLMSNLLYWLSRYDINGVLARFVGQVLGIPTQLHCKITDNIWVGAKPNRLGEMFLKFRGCTLRASLIEGDPPGNYSPLKTLFLPLEEFVAIPTERLWEYTDLLLGELEGEGKKVFIHCREGVGRAPAVAAALLMRKGLKKDEAIDLVQKGRIVTSMNQLQLHSLEQFSREISNSSL
jgi:dual specificity MAP kinase phosphatase